MYFPSKQKNITTKFADSITLQLHHRTINICENLQVELAWNVYRWLERWGQSPKMKNIIFEHSMNLCAAF